MNLLMGVVQAKPINLRCYGSPVFLMKGSQFRSIPRQADESLQQEVPDHDVFKPLVNEQFLKASHPASRGV